MRDKPDLDGPSKLRDNRWFDITARFPTLALFKGKIDKGLGIPRALFDH